MSRATNTVRVKESGERFVFRCESWTKPGEAHRVDLIANAGMGECSCAQWQIRVRPFIREHDGEPGLWYKPETTCRHIRACRKYFERQLYSDLAKTERES